MLRSLRPPVSFLVALALSACAGGGDPDAGEAGQAPVDLLIEDVRVVDVDAGRVTEGRTVAVRDGHIAAVWTADAVPEGLEVVQRVAGNGRFLLPGLWDAHVHFRGGEGLRVENRALLKLYPAFGVTTVRDAGGDLTGALMAWRDSIEAGSLLGPRILTSGPKLDGPQPAWEGSIALAHPGEVPAALDSLEALGSDYVKLYGGDHEVWMAVVREAEVRGLMVSGHMPLGVDFLEAVEAGYDATDHLYYAFKGTAANREEVTRLSRAGELGFWEAMWSTMGDRDAEREAQVFAAMVRRGTAVVPTLHIGAVLRRLELEDHSGDIELEMIPDGIEETYARRVRSARAQPTEAREDTRRLEGEMTALLGRMHQAGVTVLAGSDAGPFNSYTYPGTSLHAELRALVAAGLTPAEALRSATILPAELMGLGAESGRVETGYRADLILLDENPLEDIRNTLSLSGVVLRGETVLDRVELDALRSHDGMP